jgi:hypothetical protein
LAKLVPRDVDYGETSAFFWQRPKICFDKDLDRFLCRVNFDPYGRIPKINLVSATIPSSDDGMGHFGFSFRRSSHCLGRVHQTPPEEPKTPAVPTRPVPSLGADATPDSDEGSLAVIANRDDNRVGADG